MKYLSLVAVIIFISFTWWVSQKTQDLSIQQINKMNNLIEQYMTQAVQTNQPDASEIDFSSIQTQVIEKGRKMRANFKFSYMEPNEQGEMQKVYRKGSFLIVSEDGDKWTAQIEKAEDVQVEFMQPFTITNGQDTLDADGNPPAEQPAEEQTEEAAPEASAEH
ncbi:MAG: hypothetical protein HRT44_10150 [Bdellovibrionales bacterium]|nr:hypothetical protein [Bdellovibrionales bacterium]NQZ19602.1 hypothetical protein [Bdellovibrionales bacterium]